MKWAAGIFFALLYFVSPYYTLVDLAQSVRSADAASINRLVDWDSVRTSVKAQMRARLDKMPAPAGAMNPKFAAFDNAAALSLADALIDRMLTPAGIANLVNGVRVDASRRKVTSGARPAPAAASARPPESLYDRIRFAFFVSPIHFRLDLRAPDTRDNPTLTVMLTFKGTGWQVSDVRVSDLMGQRKTPALRPGSFRRRDVVGG